MTDELALDAFEEVLKEFVCFSNQDKDKIDEKLENINQEY